MLILSGGAACQPKEKEAASITEQNNPIVTAATNRYSGMTASEITAKLTLEEKVAQMLQPAIYNLSTDEMQEQDYGSILSDYTGYPTVSDWKKTVLNYQKAALASKTGIPYLYGTDSIHGVDKCTETVIFPQNIGIGAANDEELTYQMGLAVADEQKLTGMLWNFAPCVATAADPRWGRTYESISTDTDLVTKLSTAYAKGLMDNGILPCAKHFFGDGMVDFGTGEGDYLIDLCHNLSTDGGKRSLYG